MENVLYHGSKISGLKTIEPHEAGHGRNFVYADSDPVFAAIFINRPGGSLVQAWGRDVETKIPYLIELKKNILDINYESQKGSIYTLPKDGFSRADASSEEWMHEGTVPVLHETAIENLKDYLLRREISRSFTITIDLSTLLLRMNR